jgi:hypothetical protein
MTARAGSVSRLLGRRGIVDRRLSSHAASADGFLEGDPGGAGVVEVEMKLSIPSML